MIKTVTQHEQHYQTLTPCTPAYNHITQQVDNLDDPIQQHTVYTNEVDASLFTTDTTTPCHYNINIDMPNLNSSHENKPHTTPSRGFHSKSKHTYCNIFGDADIQYHDFDNGDALTFTDKYTALLQQELQNPYWCLHNPITTKSYQISSEMDIETMPHAMYFSGDKETITKINQVPYQVIDYDDKGMFQAKLMDNTQVEIFIDNGATPSILPLNVYNKHPILQRYPKTESHNHIHTAGGMIESHFWIEIPLRLENQIIQIKTCDSEYTIDLKYQKGSEMHSSDALSRLQNITDTPDNKDVIPLNFLQHLAPNYIEHTYSHLVENFYVHKTKSIDTSQVKRK